MSGIFSKTKSLFKSKKYTDILNTTAQYIRFIFIRLWFKITFKEMDSNLKKTNKDWIIYTYLKSRYESFLKTYQKR